SGSSAQTVYGNAGQDVTLPCRYDARYYGYLPICWGRGPVPLRRCNDEIVATDGVRVIRRKTQKYDISRRMRWGDVSLIIRNAAETDSGTYGCRVEIPGLFNDQKVNVRLIIKKACTYKCTYNNNDDNNNDNNNNNNNNDNNDDNHHT
ncbi:hypothetical protein Z043_112608, partial [Scleropages formosus]